MLGSRRQLCVNPDVVNTPGRDHKCRSLVTSRRCDYYNRLDDLKKSEQLRGSCNGMFGEEVAEGEITDIEELLQSGRDRGLCAFYLARELQYSADIIFAPYVPSHNPCCVSCTDLRVLFRTVTTTSSTPRFGARLASTCAVR